MSQVNNYVFVYKRKSSVKLYIPVSEEDALLPACCQYIVNNKPFVSIPCCSNEVFLIYKLIISIQCHLWNRRRAKIVNLLVLVSEKSSNFHVQNIILCVIVTYIRVPNTWSHGRHWRPELMKGDYIF